MLLASVGLLALLLIDRPSRLPGLQSVKNTEAYLDTYAVGMGVESQGDFANVSFPVQPIVSVTPSKEGWTGYFAAVLEPTTTTNGAFIIALPPDASVTPADSRWQETVVKHTTKSTVVRVGIDVNVRTGEALPSTIDIRLDMHWQDGSARIQHEIGRARYHVLLSNARHVYDSAATSVLIPFYSQLDRNDNSTPGELTPNAAFGIYMPTGRKTIIDASPDPERRAADSVVFPFPDRTLRDVEVRIEDQSVRYWVDTGKQSLFLILGFGLSWLANVLQPNGLSDRNRPPPQGNRNPKAKHGRR